MKTALRASLLVLALHAGIAAAQAQPPADEKPLPAKSLIAFRRSPLADLVPSPKDAGLRDALGMLEARIGELPDESMGQFPEQGADAAAQVLGLLNSPCRFAVIYNPSSMSGGAFGYGVIAGSLLGGADKAQRLQGLVEEAIQQSGEDLPKRSRSHPDMREVRTPGGKLIFGPRTFESGAGYEAYFGTVDDPDAPFASIPEPSIAGLKPFVIGTFDFSALTPAANAAQMAAGQAAAGENGQLNFVRELTASGLVGDNAMKGSFEWGTTPEASRFRVRVENAGKVLTMAGLGEGRLTASHFASIPADAITASVGLLNTDSLRSSLKKMRDQGAPVDDVLGQVKDRTGVDLEKDVLATIGGASVVYSSDTTGGGGLLSYVALMGVKDRPTLAAAHDKLRAFAAKMLEQAAEEPDGAPARYIRIREWKAKGQSAFSLTFPGVPVPLEISWALTDKWLVVGLTPQALAAAVGQAIGKGDAGILSRSDLQFTDFEKRQTLSWSFGDSKRTLRDGYGMLTLLGSAIANGVRSPSDAEREPGMVIPTFAELASGVKPAVSVAYRDGDVLMMDCISDPSLLVNLGATAGAFGRFAPLLGILGGIGAAADKGNIHLEDLGAKWPGPLAAPAYALIEAIEGPLSWISGRRALTAAADFAPSGLRLLKP